MHSMLEEFQIVGRDLFLAGLNNSHSGNLSARLGDRLLITRRGAMLGRLREEDLIETGLWENDNNTSLASTEIGVHRSIYQNTPALAIVHAHPVQAIALSLLEDEIVPIDAEGSFYFDKIPVLKAEQTIGSLEVEAKLPKMLLENKIAMLRGHGSFAAGKNLEEAYHWTTSLGNICRIICLHKLLKNQVAHR